MKAPFFPAILAALLLLTTVNAHALAPGYDSSFNPATPITLSAGQSSLLTFASASGPFTSAILDLNVSSLTNATFSIGPMTFTSPPSGVFVASSYMFTKDLQLGQNTFNLGNYLTNLNLANSSAGLNLGFRLDRGSVTFNNARLTGTVAPEPASMALVAAGLVGLPFARRLRKRFSA